MGKSVTSSSAITVRTALNRAGLKRTAQRAAVLDYLNGTGAHPTADEVFRAVNRRGGKAQLSRASVYNCLRALCDAGLVREVRFGDAVARYDALITPHHHFVCRACLRLEDLPAEPGCAPADITLPAGYRAERQELVVRGLCAACARKEARSLKSGKQSHQEE
ncbi:MAG: Fur family transcriptional regulator [Pyrinomonadaceae bacterium]